MRNLFNILISPFRLLFRLIKNLFGILLSPLFWLIGLLTKPFRQKQPQPAPTQDAGFLPDPPAEAESSHVAGQTSELASSFKPNLPPAPFLTSASSPEDATWQAGEVSFATGYWSAGSIPRGVRSPGPSHNYFRKMVREMGMRMR